MPADRLARSRRAMLRATAAGVIAGVLSAGIGARVVMRLIAILDPSTNGAFTDAEATVGEITLEGSAQFLIFGSILGAVSGLVYLGLRRWLPVGKPWRGIAYGALTLVTIGQPLFDPANVDFQIFEPVIVVVALFAALFFLNGFVVAKLLDRWHPEPEYQASTRMPRITAGVLVIFLVLGSILFAGGTIGLVEDQGSCLSAIGSGNGCAVAAD